MIFVFDEWELDSELFELRQAGQPLKVEPQVFDLLLCLVLNRDRVVSREEIVESVWSGRHVTDATISTCLKSARKTLADDGRSQRYIRTVRGRGMRFVGEVLESPGSEAKPKASPEVDVPESPPPESSHAEQLISSVTEGPPGRTTVPDKPVIAVLPFDNLSANVEAYFADGLTEDIITNLARFRELQVIARTSTFQFRELGLSLLDFCARANADYVVEGSVRRAGGRVRITAQLIDARSGLHLWADHFDREMEDLFAVQDEVTRMIAATLGVRVQDAAQRRALRKSTTELDAYDCVLRARGFTSILSSEAHGEARDLLEAAIRLDPQNADAHALLANVYLAEHRFGTNPRPDPIGRALCAAQIAIRHDPQNAYAHCWLAVVHFFRGETNKFKDEAERALSLNPNDPEILADIGHFLAFMGEYARGTELLAQAMKLNPLHPGWYFFGRALHSYSRAEYVQTLAEVERIAMPQFYWTHFMRAAALAQLERPEACEVVDRVYELKPDFDALSELGKWNVAPADRDLLLEGFHKAASRR